MDRCIFSFVEMYKKLDTNMPEIILLREEDRQRLVKGFGVTAQHYGLYLQTCATGAIFPPMVFTHQVLSSLICLGRRMVWSSNISNTVVHVNTAVVLKHVILVHMTVVQQDVNIVTRTKALPKPVKCVTCIPRTRRYCLGS